MKVYSSPASRIDFEPDKSLLRATWLESAKDLTPDEVKEEITHVFNFAKEFNIKRIIVDARLYPFRENYDLQYWINFSFMPKIMDCEVEKYAIVIDQPITPKVESFYGKDSDFLQVEYFIREEAALVWIEP